MKDIAIYGAGGFGREVACLIRMINEAQPEESERWNLIGFFDDGISAGTSVSHYGVCLGGIGTLNNWRKELSVTISIGNPQTIREIVEQIHNPLIQFPNIIHPNLTCADIETFKIGRGNIIMANCYMSCDVVIGDFNILNGSIAFGHDVQIGNYNTFMPKVLICGGVHIGNENFFGIGSNVLQLLRIGNKVKLGAGSVLMTKPKDDSLYMGNPAKIFKY